MFYIVKTPWALKKLYSGCTWNISTNEKVIYLTFDDGPHPQATPFVLDELKKYEAKATFFCIGKNVIEQQQVFRQILEQGHRIGNHTHNHLNGFKSSNETYFQNIREAAKYIDSNLFRPPYGRISHFQLNLLQSKKFNYKVIMWDVLSGDFDKEIDGEKCTSNVIMNATKGSIVIFHDSEKAFERMKVALPKTLLHFASEGYRFESIK